MILKNLEIDKDGKVESTWVLTQEQYYTLLNFAIHTLLEMGAATVAEMSPKEVAEFKKELENDALTRALERIDPKDLPQG